MITAEERDLDDIDVTPAMAKAALAAEATRTTNATRIEHAVKLVDTLRDFDRFLATNPVEAFNTRTIRTQLAQAEGLLARARALAKGSR